MTKTTAALAKAINLLALAVAVVWAVSRPDYEPIVTSLVLLATLVGIFVAERATSNRVLEILHGVGYPFEVTEPADAKGRAIRCLAVGIRNSGNQHIDNCLVKLERIKAADGRDFKNIFVPVGLVTQHQQLQQRRGGRFNLSPKETKYVRVACLDETQSNTEIALQYEPTIIRILFREATTC